MKLYKIAIEETVVQEFEIVAENASEALQIAQENYYKGIFVLEPGDAHSKQMAVVSPDNKINTWIEF